MRVSVLATFGTTKRKNQFVHFPIEIEMDAVLLFLSPFAFLLRFGSLPR